MASMIDLALEALARQDPKVSFITDYPGAVRSGISREANSPLTWLVFSIVRIIGPLFYIPTKESGERHPYLATNARFPPRADDVTASDLALTNRIKVALGTHGTEGSGVYSVDWSCETSGQKLLNRLAKLCADGVSQTPWEYTESEHRQITE